jgi:hypothetical protein
VSHLPIDPLRSVAGAGRSPSDDASAWEVALAQAATAAAQKPATGDGTQDALVVTPTAPGNEARAGRAAVPAADQQPATGNGSQRAQPEGREGYGGLLDRGRGILQAGIGVVEVVGGTAGAVLGSETVVAAVVGSAVAVHGVDDIQAGLRQARSGKPTETLTEQVATEAAKRAGATSSRAVAFGAMVDVVAGGVAGSVEKGGVELAEGALRLGEDVVEVGKGANAAAKGEEAVAIGAAVARAAGAIEEWLGPGITRVQSPTSDLVLRSADGTRQVRFDVSAAHGLDPHINVETWQPRNLYPGDKKFVQTANEHVFLKP